MRIAEIYSSVQGEGLLTGTLSTFVRASGCNLRCAFCDTPFTSWHPEGDDLSVEQIVAAVVETAPTHVVLTGGEPMLFAELVPLCQQLSDAGLHLTIETAGTLLLPVTCDLMSISPKLSNSTPPFAQAGGWTTRHEKSRWHPEVVRRLIEGYPYQLKFVIAQPADLAEVDQYLQQLGGVARNRVLLMPEGTDAARLAELETWLRPHCNAQGLRFCPRRQIEWYGHTRRT
jgi:7-carboxy-7-deazaguanine synthase